jgi:hypothetical protein
MIMDKNLVFCESTSIAAAAGASTVLTDVVYIPRGRDHKGTLTNSRYNVSGKLFWNCVVEDEDLLAAVDGSVLTFALYNDTDSTPTTGGDIILSAEITENTPTEHPDGTLLFSIPLPVTQLKEYFGVKVSVATQDLSTGKVTSWIGGPPQLGT